jgi:hypothetical protein
MYLAQGGEIAANRVIVRRYKLRFEWINMAPTTIIARPKAKGISHALGQIFSADRRLITDMIKELNHKRLAGEIIEQLTPTPAKTNARLVHRYSDSHFFR